MNYRTIPLETYPRRDHFSYFKEMAQPYAGLTVSVDITGFMRRVRGEDFPFFLSFLYCVSRAANGVPQLRQRILNGGIVEYETCPTSHTEALEDGTYCYCTLDSRKPFAEYLPDAKKAQAEAKQQKSLDDGEEVLSLFFISSLPWLSYEAIVQPTPNPADSNPRITWGKYRQEGDRTVLPVSILCHHALVDGLHLAQFYQKLDQELARFTESDRV